MRPFRNISLTKLAGVLIAVYVIVSVFSAQRWNHEDGVIRSDVRGYYTYLPAIFIHNDLKLKNVDVYLNVDRYNVWFTEDEQGNRYTKFTYGLAALYSPFFIGAHIYTTLTGGVADGFSPPYQFALALSSIVFLLLGIVFFSKFLSLFFKDHIVAITMITIYGATNLFNYYTVDMAYSHGYSFALICVFLYASTKWTLNPHKKWILWIGLTFGFMVLIRPIDIVFGLFPLLVFVQSTEDAKKRFVLLWKKRKQLLVMFILFLFVLFPQFLYTNYTTGKWVFYSYSGESFFFLRPHLFDSLFNYRNGWLVYSPIMFLSIIGIGLLFKIRKTLSPAVLSISLLYYYLLASWWCWWFVGFGNRAYINLYPILALALAAFIHFIENKDFWLKSLFRVSLIGCILLNVFQTSQYENGTIHWGAMTKKAYWDVFLKERPTQLYETYLEHPVTEEQLKGNDMVTIPRKRVVFSKNWSFETPEKYSEDQQHVISNQNKAIAGEYSFTINEGVEFPFALNLNVAGANAFYYTAWVHGEADSLKLIISDKKAQECYFASSEVIQTRNDWNQFHIYASLKSKISNDSLIFYFWNQDRKKLLIDDLNIIGYDVKYVTKEIR